MLLGLWCNNKTGEMDRRLSPVRSSSVLFVHSSVGGAQRYRCVHPAEELALYGVRSNLCLTEDRQLSQKVRESDVVVFHRVPADKRVISIIRAAREDGILTLFDIDDLVFEPSLLPLLRGLNRATSIEKSLHKDEMGRYRKAMSLSDGCIVSTENLAQRVLDLDHPAWVVRNAFGLEMLSISEEASSAHIQSKGNLVIGYASGTPTHDFDFEQAASALREVLSERPEAELWIVGHLSLGKGWDSLGSRIKRIPYVPWRELPGILAGFDINIAPLEIGNPFCQAKSEIKWMEAAMVGVPTIASRTSAFEHAIDQGKTGLLAASSDDWYEHLATLADDSLLRRKMGEQARETVFQRYHPLVRGRELIWTLNDISEQVHGQPLWPGLERVMEAPDLTNWEPAPRVSFVCDAPIGKPQLPLLQKAWYSLRYRGLRILLLQGMVFLAKHMVWRKD